MLRVEQISHADVSFDAAWRARRGPYYEPLVKRLLDLLLAALGLVTTLPIWLVIAAVIKLGSPGPAIFVQERVGQHGRRFRFYKFRSMYVDAEQRFAEVEARNEAAGPVFKMRRDPRVTPIGALLRRTSLDELPQLLNVLKGDMSLVGPRPPLPKEVEQYSPNDLIRLSVKPGLTCLWQIRGRSTVGFDQWMEYDREYVRNMSLGLDISILLRTVRAVVSMRGAY